VNKTLEDIRKMRAALYERIAADIKGTSMTYAEIARKHEVSTAMVYLVARTHNCRRTFAGKGAEGRE
jgi:transposase-like protein